MYVHVHVYAAHYMYYIFVENDASTFVYKSVSCDNIAEYVLS